MSILLKTPFIESVIGSLTTAELTRLSSVINTTGATPVKMSLQAGVGTLPSSAPAQVNDKIKLVEMTLGNSSYCTGVLIYHSTDKCALIGTSASDKDILKLFKIDVANRKAIPVEEKLTADELRRVLDDCEEAAPGGKDAWVERMKEVMDYDEDDNEVQVGTKLYVDGETKVNKFGAWSGDSRKIDFNPTNDTTSFYGHVRIGNDETPTDFKLNSIESVSEVNGSTVMFAKYNPTQHQDNHWHLVNTKVDDSFHISGNLSVGTLGVYDITDLVLSGEATQDDLTEILQAYASGKFVMCHGCVMTPQEYKPYQQASTDETVLMMNYADFTSGVISFMEQITFTKNEDGSLTITLEEV